MCPPGVRIALFCPSFGEVGGIERKAEALLHEFRRAGHDVTVLARGATARDDGHDLRIVRVPFHQLPRRARHVVRELRFRRQLPRVLATLRRALAAWRGDVVLSLAIDSYAPYAAGLARAVPVVLGLETGGPGLTTRPRSMRTALARAHRVVAVAASLARGAETLDPRVAPRLRVIPNGVDVTRFADEGPPFDHPRPFVLAVARLSREKGLDVLLDAVARLPATAPDLLVAGNGPERDTLARQVERLGLERCVRFLGAVDPDAVAGLYRSALLVACPSRWEGLPLACLEAMASARAVVATAVGGIPDVVTHGETGVLVPPGDVPALAAAIRALADDATERRRLGRQARAHVAEAYAWPTIARRHLDVLAEAVRERNGAA